METMTSQILIGEDDLTPAEVLSRFLRRDGYGVEVADDGPSGLARGSFGDHDPVVLDLMLPAMSGLEVCAAHNGTRPCWRQPTGPG